MMYPDREFYVELEDIEPTWLIRFMTKDWYWHTIVPGSHRRKRYCFCFGEGSLRLRALQRTEGDSYLLLCRGLAAAASWIPGRSKQWLYGKGSCAREGATSFFLFSCDRLSFLMKNSQRRKEAVKVWLKELISSVRSSMSSSSLSASFSESIPLLISCFTVRRSLLSSMRMDLMVSAWPYALGKLSARLLIKALMRLMLSFISSRNVSNTESCSPVTHSEARRSSSSFRLPFWRMMKPRPKSYTTVMRLREIEGHGSADKECSAVCSAGLYAGRTWKWRCGTFSG